MGGEGAWRNLSPDDGLSTEQIKAHQRAWRSAHPYVVALWKALDNAAIRAVQNPCKVIKLPRQAWQWGSFISDGIFLRMSLPSGRSLAYPLPELKTGKFDNPVVSFKDVTLGKWGDCRHGQGAYGGLWVENAVSGIARDILADAMRRLETTGYKIVLHVHDEVVAEVPDGFGSTEEFLRILITPPTWAASLPLAAKVRNGQRFCKPKPTTPDEPVIDRDPEPTHEDPQSEESEPEPEQPDNDADEELPFYEHHRHSSDGHVHGDSGPKRGETVARWFYRNPPDQPNYLRVDKHITPDGERKFYQHHWNGMQWVQGVKGTYAERKILYRLPELKAALKANPDTEVQLLEGEKDADTITLRVVRYPDVPEGEDVTWWMEEGGHTAEELAERIKAAKPDAPAPLPFINMSNWDSEPVPEQEWTVFDKIPRRQPALFSGEGGTGKSMEGLHLTAAHVLGRDCWHTMPERGPAIFVDAEDEERVLHIRLAAIIEHYGVTFADLIKGGLHLISFAGKDAVMATVNRNGKIEPTAVYRLMLEAAGDIKPIQIVIASSANVFAGNEIDRSQVQQFVGLLTSITLVANGSLVLCSHPSLSGISSGSGLSGTTQWHNAVRARFFMKGVKPEDGEQPDNDLREIEFKKNQYGKISDSIVLRYQAGIYLPVPGASFDKLAREAKAEEIFLELLRRLTMENRLVSDKKSSAYAPAVFARENEARGAGITSPDFAEAMRRLFAAKKIWNEPWGRPSRPSYRIALKI